jgi:hypothetical protein
LGGADGAVTDATVEVGVVEAGVLAGVGVVDDAVVEAAGDGETMEAGLAAVVAVVVVDAALVGDAALVEDDCGLEASLGSPLANGLRGRLASSVLTETGFAAALATPA